MLNKVLQPLRIKNEKEKLVFELQDQSQNVGNEFENTISRTQSILTKQHLFVSNKMVGCH